LQHTTVDEHAARVARLRAAFAEANNRFLTRLRGADDEEAVRAPAGGGWSAAQIGWHVAAVSSRFARLISGELPGAAPLGEGFRERSWSEIVSGMPAGLEAPGPAQPPAAVTRAQAVALVEASGDLMTRALDGVTPERGSRFGIVDPIVGGAISLYQVAEWATGHIIRHNQQAKRTLRA
jgi:DinB superfamily